MTIAIRQIRILDGLGHRIERGTLLIEGTRIQAVGPERDVRLPKGAQRIDGRGLTVLPGLIDCHVHFCLGAEADVVAAVEENLRPSPCSKPPSWRAALSTPGSPLSGMWDSGTMRCSP